MTTLARSFSRIDSDKPQALARFADRFRSVGNMAETALQLQYRVEAGAAEPQFSYRTASHSPAAVATLPERLVDATVWASMRIQYLLGSLDIAVVGYDTLVEVETFGPDLSWSLDEDAVVIRDGHPHLYDQLRYWNGSEWKTRLQFDKPFCRLIRFRARHNKDGHVGEKHKFSYNVVFSVPSGNPIPYEIDPDIQNPKV